MNILLLLLLQTVNLILSIFTFSIYVSVVMSWLVSFNILNPSGKFVSKILSVVSMIVDPVLNEIRKYLPIVCGLDLSPLVALFGVYLIRMLLGTMVGFIL